MFKDGDFYGVGITDSLGDATIVFDPPITSVGDAELIVSGYNCLPDTFNTAIVPAGSAYVVYYDHEIEEITGNGNGLPDYGEYAYLDLWMENVGDLDAENVTVTISTGNEYLSIEDSTENYGTITAGSTMYVNDGYTFNVADNAPDQHLVDITVKADDGTKELWSSGFQMTLLAPVLEIGNITVKDTIDGDGNGFLDPGETAVLILENLNTGHSDALEAHGYLTSEDNDVVIEDTAYQIGLLPFDNEGVTIFVVTVSEDAPLGMPLTFDYLLQNGSYQASESFVMTVGLIVEDFETAGFNAFPWGFSGSAPWTICQDDPYEGSYCIKSGEIGNSSTSIISINLDILADGEISFFRKVSSEPDYDFLKFKIDDNEVGSWSGEEAWGQETYPVTAGNHTFSWIYEKDVYVSNGEDCAWVDYIVFPPHSSSVGIEKLSDISFKSSVYPNPFKGQVSFEINLPSEAATHIAIFNVFGQEVITVLDNTALGKGQHTFDKNLDDLPAGWYLCRISIGGEVALHKLLHVN
jgi:hypothetical protein